MRNYPLRSTAIFITIVSAIAVALVFAVSRDALTALVTAEPSGAEQSVQATHSPASSSTGLTEEEAISAAHTVAPQTVDRELRVVRSGPISDVWPDSSIQDWASDLPPDAPVWYLYFQGDDDLGTIVLLHDADASVIYLTDVEAFTVP